MGLDSAVASYRVAAALIMLLFGIAGILSGESIYRRGHVYLLDPDTDWGKRTRLDGRAARILGIILMVFGVFFLVTAIAGVFLSPLLR